MTAANSQILIICKQYGLESWSWCYMYISEVKYLIKNIKITLALSV